MKTRNKHLRAALIAVCFCAEFGLALLGIVSGYTTAYALAAVTGCVIPAFSEF